MREMTKWLSSVMFDGWSVLSFCARYQKKEEALIKLLEYGGEYLPKKKRWPSGCHMSTTLVGAFFICVRGNALGG